MEEKNCVNIGNKKSITAMLEPRRLRTLPRLDNYRYFMIRNWSNNYVCLKVIYALMWKRITQCTKKQLLLEVVMRRVSWNPLYEGMLFVILLMYKPIEMRDQFEWITLQHSTAGVNQCVRHRPTFVGLQVAAEKIYR